VNTSLLAAWEATVAMAPDAVALVDAAMGRTWTRGELDAEAAAWCRAHGAGLARRTVLIAEANGAGWLYAFVGLLKATAVAAALDPGEPAEVQRTIATALGAAAVWDGGELRRGETLARAARDERRVMKLTSGSTGRPRALAFTDAQMLADGRQVCASMGIAPGDVNLGLIPFGHSYGLGNLVLPLLMQGTAIVCGVPALPQAMAAAVARYRPTVFPAVPALLRALAVADVAAAELASLRTVISAGAALSPEVAQAFHAKTGKRIHSFYGSSETGGISYDRTGEASLAARSVGTPLEGVRLSFERGGRFVVESAAVFTIGNRRVSADGVGSHRPADTAELNSLGEIVLRGRVGRFVKIAGRRLNLAEVEQALRNVPGVRDALVVPHAGRADALAAALATESTADAVREVLRSRLAPWKIPKKIVVLPAFPLTPRGKTDARRVRAILGSPGT
jgi:acyl-coenzyme A synthetase/AMP-(fatty) acid ligase